MNKLPAPETADSISRFAHQSYLKLSGAISRDLAIVAANMLLIAESRGQLSKDQIQVPGTTAIHGHPLLDAILLWTHPLIERHTGCELCPTYSYARIYRHNDELKAHRDRPSCEISATLTLDYRSDYLWPIWVESNDKDIDVPLDRGDLMIYKGCEVKHWRDKFTGKTWIQVFLHYINKQGPHYPEFAFDKRKGVVPVLYQYLMQSAHGEGAENGHTT